MTDLPCLLENSSAFLMALTTSGPDFLLLSVCGRGGGGGLTCDCVLRYHGAMTGRQSSSASTFPSIKGGPGLHFSPRLLSLAS